MSACNALTPAATRRPTKAATQSTPKASAKPSLASSHAPTASPTPEGPMTALKGSVTLDAHYLLSNNAGSLISNNGSSAIALKGGTLISDNGLGLISDNGLGLISDNGLGLISDNGLGLVSNNAGGYRVLAADDVPVGALLPVKGMAVFPIAMRTGEVVGKPVFTDAQGQYTLNVPESLKGNVRVIAKVPVAKADDPLAKDPRTTYSLVADPAASAAIDEDTALATKYLRACFASRIKLALTTQDLDGSTAELLRALTVPDFLIDTLKASIADLNKVGKAKHVEKLSDAKQTLVAQRATDVMLSYLDLAHLNVDSAAIGRPDDGINELALPAMADLLKQIRSGATAAMAADPTFFTHQTYLLHAHAPHEVRKPADMGDFIVDEYLLSTEDRLTELAEDVFPTIGLGWTQASRLNTVSLGILAAVGQTLFSNADAKAEMLKAVEASATP